MVWRPSVPDPSDPFVLFEQWFAEASAAEPAADAASLATVDAAGQPSNRVVLVKRVSADGFEFHTNYRSRKGRELAANPRAALAYHWKSLGRSVRVEGVAEPLGGEESDAYWYSRPRASRISARISEQSEPVGSRTELEERSAGEAARIGEGEVERPAHWGGYRLVPLRIEFWTHRDDRLHDRLEFTRPSPGAPWSARRLQP
jgi:pyridoxamine 5'-phosphate oxidase